MFHLLGRIFLPDFCYSFTVNGSIEAGTLLAVMGARYDDVILKDICKLDVRFYFPPEKLDAESSSKVYLLQSLNPNFQEFH